MSSTFDNANDNASTSPASTSPRVDLPMSPIIIHDEHTPARRFSAVWLPDSLDQRPLWQDMDLEDVHDLIYDYLESIRQCGIPARLWQEYAENIRRTPFEFAGAELSSVVRGYATAHTVRGVNGARIWAEGVGDVAHDYVRDFLAWCVTYMAPVDMSTYDFSEELVAAWMFSHDHLDDFLLMSFTSLMVYAGADVLVTPLSLDPHIPVNRILEDPAMCVDVRVTITPHQVPAPDEEGD